MNTIDVPPYTGFIDKHLVAAGSLELVAAAIKGELDRGTNRPIFIFDNYQGRDVELDFRGSEAEVLARIASPNAESEGASNDASWVRPRPGRPKLGVVAREVTLLPRHWDWLSKQPGGASVTLRKLVEEARRTNHAVDQARHGLEVAYNFMYCLAGDCPNFEEASRALFAKDFTKVLDMTGTWPESIGQHTRILVEAAKRSEEKSREADHH